jgi:hypothetical protein
MPAGAIDVIQSLGTNPFTPEQQHKSDFYEYLKSPENQQRYKPISFFLSSIFNTRKTFSLLDVCCANGDLIPHLPENCRYAKRIIVDMLTFSRYVGIDHNEDAIAKCKKKYSEANRDFLCSDIRSIPNLTERYYTISDMCTRQGDQLLKLWRLYWYWRFYCNIRSNTYSVYSRNIQVRRSSAIWSLMERLRQNNARKAIRNRHTEIMQISFEA